MFKNDEKTVEEIRRMNPKGILFPRSRKAGRFGNFVGSCGKIRPGLRLSVYGAPVSVVLGGTITRAPLGLMHGKSSPVFHKTDVSTVLLG